MGWRVKNLCLGNLKGIMLHDAILRYKQQVACCYLSKEGGIHMDSMRWWCHEMGGWEGWCHMISLPSWLKVTTWCGLSKERKIGLQDILNWVRFFFVWFLSWRQGLWNVEFENNACIVRCRNWTSVHSFTKMNLVPAAKPCSMRVMSLCGRVKVPKLSPVASGSQPVLEMTVVCNSNQKH